MWSSYLEGIGLFAVGDDDPQDEWYPQDPDSNKVFDIANCF